MKFEKKSTFTQFVLINLRCLRLTPLINPTNNKTLCDQAQLMEINGVH